MDSLIKLFDLKDVQKAGAIFDKTKLDYLNTQHIANLTLDEFKAHIYPFLYKKGIKDTNHEKIDDLLDALRTSGCNFEQIAASLVPYFSENFQYDNKAIERFVKPNINIIDHIIDSLETIDDKLWEEQKIDEILGFLREKLNLKVPELNQPIRIALTGSTKSPSLGLTLSFFSKEVALSRINKLKKVY